MLWSAGRKTRYAYLTEMDTVACQKNAAPMMVGLVKLDLSLPGDQAVVGRISHGENVFGGEAFFVPAHEDPSQCTSELLNTLLVTGLLGSETLYMGCAGWQQLCQQLGHRCIIGLGPCLSCC